MNDSFSPTDNAHHKFTRRRERRMACLKALVKTGSLAHGGRPQCQPHHALDLAPHAARLRSGVGGGVGRGATDCPASGPDSGRGERSIPVHARVFRA